MDTRMCRKGTVGPVAALAFLLLLAAGPGWTQVAPRSSEIRSEWRRIGNSAVEMSLASVATGPVERIWYSPEGTTLYAWTSSGKTFETNDFESWKQVAGASRPPVVSEPVVNRKPEAEAVVRAQPGIAGRVYAAGRHAYRSEDNGRSWRNLTASREGSIVGDGLTDLAVSPMNPDEIVVANRFGVWRSVDGGASWSGMNETLPNLPVRRLLAVPQGTRGARLALDSAGVALEVEWAPGEKSSWKPRADAAAALEAAQKRELSRLFGVTVTALTVAGSYVYVGSADGRLWVSLDQGRDWLDPRSGLGGRVEAFWTDPSDPRRALAAVASREGARVLRTMNGGLFWDDLSGNLPNAAAHGVAADGATGAIYLATDGGLYLTVTNLGAAAPAPVWTSLAGGLPQGAVTDVRLDEGGNQVFVAVDGYGVFAAIAPHRLLALRAVSAADYTERAAAPGALLSVLGGRVSAARAGDRTAPVLAATDAETQIQVPFEAAGSALALGLELSGRRLRLGLPLRSVAPAVFVDRDGTPMVLDADRGILLDAMTPARSGSRIQILATGLGRVQPEWPTGMAAPLESPPRVVAPVKVYLDRAPVEVTRATLAPGYIGFYLVEVRLPEIVNLGPAELYLEADGQPSNRVSVYLQP